MGQEGEPEGEPWGLMVPPRRGPAIVLNAKGPSVSLAVKHYSRSSDAASIVLAELERRAERVRCGSLTTAGDAVLDHRTTALAEHVDAYLEHVGTKRSKGGKPRVNAVHLSNVRYRLARVVGACGFSRLGDLNRDAVERRAVKAKSDGMGARTINAHLAALTAFGTWCVDTRRLEVNPFARLRKLDLAADLRA